MASHQRLYISSTTSFLKHSARFQPSAHRAYTSSSSTSSSWRASASPSIQPLNQRQQPRTQPPRCRALSSTARAHLPSGARARQPSQPSSRAILAQQQAELQRSGAVLDYIGLLDGTLIMPRTSPRLPSWLAAPRARLALEWRRLRTRALELLQGGISAKFLVRPRVPVFRGRREATAFAARAYEDMNSALARGVLEPVAGVLAQGLRESLQRRVEGRAAGTGLRWRLERWVERPQIVSWKFMLLPAAVKDPPKDTRHGVLQCVVRLKSRQSLLRTRKARVVGGVVGGRKKGAGEAVAGAREVVEEVVVDAEGNALETQAQEEEERRRSEKETVEYLVVQRLMKSGRMGPWVVWGTAEESSLEKIHAEEERMQQHIMGQRR